MVLRFARAEKPRALVAIDASHTYILAMGEKEIIERPGRPNKIVSRRERMRSRVWVCSNCGIVTTSPEPIHCPVLCARCGGIAFETANPRLQ